MIRALSGFPLHSAWLPALPPADLDKKSREWLASDAPVAVLMGASHLISSPERGDVVKRLESLTSAKDPRIAALAVRSYGMRRSPRPPRSK